MTAANSPTWKAYPDQQTARTPPDRPDPGRP